MPPDSVLLSEYNADSTGMEVRAAIQATTPLTLVNDTSSSNNGLQVATARVPVIAKGTATLAALGIRVLRIPNDDVTQGLPRVLDDVRSAIQHQDHDHEHTGPPNPARLPPFLWGKI